MTKWVNGDPRNLHSWKSNEWCFWGVRETGLSCGKMVLEG